MFEMSDQRRHLAEQHYSSHSRSIVAGGWLDADQPKRIVFGVLNHQLDSLNGKCVRSSLDSYRSLAFKLSTVLVFRPNSQDVRAGCKFGGQRGLP